MWFWRMESNVDHPPVPVPLLYTAPNLQPATCKLHPPSVKQCLPSVNHEQFPIQMTRNCKHSKCLQILAERRFKFIGERIEEDNREGEGISLSIAVVLGHRG